MHSASSAGFHTEKVLAKGQAILRAVFLSLSRPTFPALYKGRSVLQKLR